MDKFKELFSKGSRSELILVILLIIYFFIGFKTPLVIANFINTLAGKIVIILIVIYLFINSNPITAVLAGLVAFYLITNSASLQNSSELNAYAPSQEKKNSQFTAFNQFPYTLEQEVVAKMAPVVHSGISITRPSFNPILEDQHDAMQL